MTANIRTRASLALALLFLAACAPAPLVPGEKTDAPWQCREQAKRGGDCGK